MTEQLEYKKVINISTANQNEFWLGKNPTPQERGELIVKRLEQVIRGGRSEKGGVSFKRWQEMAVHEVANTIQDAERHWHNNNQFITRGLSIGAATITTIGFWGTIMAAEVAPDRQTAALIFILAGVLLIILLAAWCSRRFRNLYQVRRRQNLFKRVIKFDRHLAQLNADLKKQVVDLKGTLANLGKEP
jgi:hypothetical protein